MQWICGSSVCNVWTIFNKVKCFGALILEIMSGKKNTSYHNGENM